jgi:glucokinase
VDNDVNMMALAELRHGAARGARNVCCITVGTGIGGGLIIEGALYRGRAMSAGELGHIQVEPEGIPCGCGNRGCLERYVGRDGLLRLARLAMKGKQGSLRRWEPLTPISLAEAARTGHPVAREVWERAGRYLGLALVGVVNLLNPDIIVIGGGIARAGRLLLDPARRIVRERALRIAARHVRVVRSTLGADAGIIGAASEVLALADQRR